MSRPRVLVISSEPVGERMAGPAIRSLELARALAGRCQVTLAAPGPSQVPVAEPTGASTERSHPEIDLLPASVEDYATLLAAAERHDVVIAQQLPAQMLGRVAASDTRYVADMYNPTVVEAMEALGDRTGRAAERAHRLVTRQARAQLAAADLVLCASTRQRDLWLGGMALAGYIDPAAYRADPTLRSRMMVVPFGVPDRDPAPAPDASPWPGVPDDARVLLWGGGIWRWLDAVTPIRALARIRERHDGVHLVFLGTGRPVAADDGVSTAEQAEAEARRLGVLDAGVHFNRGWVPYEQRDRLLAAAHLGVFAHHDHLETRFAYRTRVLDSLWAGLPVVATEGDVLSELAAGRDAGVTVPAGDDHAMAAACEQLLEPGAYRAASDAARTLADELRWSTVIEPLAAWCEDPPPPVARPRRRIWAATATQYPAVAVDVVERSGPRELGRRVVRVVRRTVRRS
ncbi:MAG: glycosyltransferase family 4 protein [Solirubrobacterales bacterium]